MKKSNIKNTIESLQADISSISDTNTKKILNTLFNLMEVLAGDNERLFEENQQLKNEVNHLKGEQGKPDIKGKKKNPPTDHSSENERKSNDKSDANQGKKTRRNRKPKLPNITIVREQLCIVDKTILPDDAQFKGYTDTVIQDIKIITDNVKYRREIYYSHSLKKTFLGTLPKDVAGKGEFGVGIRSLIPLFKSECKLSEKCILDFMHNFGIVISKAYISNQWTKGYDQFHLEKNDIIAAGLSSTDYQQIDDTGARVNGENHYTQIICNPYYSAFFTTPRKDRLTILDVVTNFAPRQFLYNDSAIQLLKGFKLSRKIRRVTDKLLDKNLYYDKHQFNILLDSIEPGPQQLTRIKEACAIAAYHEQTSTPVINILMSDDAPQFKLIARHNALCWVHDGRLYKKLNPIVPQHQKALDDFLDLYWVYYRQLKAYKESPNHQQAEMLSVRFNELFSTKTEYEQLNDRIAKTLAKQNAMIMVLKHPQLPLHNNASELAARVQARERDISLHTMSEAGTKAKDTFMTISQTAKKLGVRTYDYIRDRVSGAFNMTALAQLVIDKSLADQASNSPIP